MTTLYLESRGKLGKKIKKMSYTKFNTRGEDVYYSVKTGILDYLGDEIILSVFPNKNLVTDEGYTGYSMETGRYPIDVSKARLLIESHGAILTDAYYQHIEMTYEGDDWEEVAKQLTSCIVDVYAVLT